MVFALSENRCIVKEIATALAPPFSVSTSGALARKYSSRNRTRWPDLIFLSGSKKMIFVEASCSCIFWRLSTS